MNQAARAASQAKLSEVVLVKRRKIFKLYYSN